MIGNELVRELVETVILTGRVKNGDPVSLLLIAAPESGKTSVVLERPCKTVEAFGDVTGRGIHKIITEKPELTHIIINDLVAVLSHKQSVNRYTLSQLNAITEEGITSIATPSGIETFKCGKRGVIASLTTELAKDSRFWWSKIGFTSRMLPFSYKYPDALIIKIKNALDERSVEGTSNGHKKAKEFPVPDRSISVEYPEKLAKQVRRIADLRSHYLEEQGMRRLKQYHNLTQAHALLRSKQHSQVNDSDVEFVERIDMYCSYEQPREL